ncbi:uncharacterized protein BROUX77_002481 [Berkeleyomyces rouxiae]|uniref:uncharacterized protein n=1 Tax=Berkeleyomyces rouxiae TaxID=2035830 RepID=UPI003B7D3B1B
MIRVRRGAILPVAIVTVLLFVISAHVFTSPESWSQWTPSAVVGDKAAEKALEPAHGAATASTAGSAHLQTEAATPSKAQEGGHDATHQEPNYPTHTPSLLELARNSPPQPSLNMTFDVPDDIKYNPAGPRPDQVVILTAADTGGHHGAIPKMHERVAANRQAYCDLHGYKYHFVDISKIDLPNANPVWKKIPAIVQAFIKYPDAQWVMMVDFDIIIMEPEQDLNSLILSREAMEKNLLLSTEVHGPARAPTGTYSSPTVEWKNIDYIIAQDHNGLNAGTFFVRRSIFSQLLMDVWADPFLIHGGFVNEEQDAMYHLFNHHPVVRKHIGLMKQRVANSFYEGDDDMRYHEGDLLVHFAGCWVQNKCLERFEDMWERRKIAPSTLSDAVRAGKLPSKMAVGNHEDDAETGAETKHENAGVKAAHNDPHA